MEFQSLMRSSLGRISELDPPLEAIFARKLPEKDRINSPRCISGFRDPRRAFFAKVQPLRRRFSREESSVAGTD
jgi:hypothetical protein